MIESVDFDIPNQVVNMLVNGDAIRYGGVIRNKTGQVLYHLRETAAFTENISIINNILPHTGDIVSVFSKITPGVNTLVSAYKVFQEHKTHKMLGEIKEQLTDMEKVLQSTQMFSAVGMASSLITLGVVVASFYVLNKKLNNITSTLNEINDQLLKMNQKIDSIESFLKESVFANLKSSIEELDQTKFLTSEKEKRQRILSVNSDFKKCKFKFENVIEKLDPKKFETYDKFYKGLALSIMGEIQASLYLNEFDLTQDVIKKGSEMLNIFNNKFSVNDITNEHINLLEMKVGGKSALISNDKLKIKKEITEESIKTEGAVLKEIFERVDSLKYEVDTMQKHNLSYNEWKNLSNDYNSRSGIVLIKLK